MKKFVFTLLIAAILVALLSSMALAAAPEAAPDVGYLEATDDAVAVQPVADVGDPDPGGLEVFMVMITLAILIESLAEVVKAAISPATLPKWVWFLITSIIGMVLCILFRVDLFAALGFAGGAAAVWISEILTGIAVGAGSGFVHSILGKLTASKDADKSIASGQGLIITGDVVTNEVKRE